MGIDEATELASLDAVCHRVWGMEQLKSTLRISPQNSEVRGGNLIGRSPTAYEGWGNRLWSTNQCTNFIFHTMV